MLMLILNYCHKELKFVWILNKIELFNNRFKIVILFIGIFIFE